MNRFIESKFINRVLISFFIVMLAISGCSQPSAITEKAKHSVSSSGTVDYRLYTAPLSLIEVKTALILEGLQLSDNKEISPTDYQINNVKPAVYTINQSDQVLLIYIFKSIAERMEVCWDGYLGFFPPPQFPQKENYLNRSYVAGNVLIIDMVDVSRMQSITEIEQVLKPLRKVVLSLNGSHEAVFADKGTNWDASYIVNYYEHWYKDDKGLAHVDQYSNGKWVVKYIGPDPQFVHDIRYECKTPGRSGSGNRNFLKIGEDYYLRIGNDEGNSIPDKDSVITITIQWDGKEESLNLKMISRKSNLPLFLSAI